MVVVSVELGPDMGLFWTYISFGALGPVTFLFFSVVHLLIFHFEYRGSKLIVCLENVNFS